MALLSNKKSVLCLLLLCSMFGLAVFFAAVSAEAATPKYVYIISPSADVVKYDVAAGKTIASFNMNEKPGLKPHLPDEVIYSADDWALSENGVFFDGKNMLLYVSVPPSGSGEKAKPHALLKIQLPEWSIQKAINPAESYETFISPDKKKIFWQHTVDETEVTDVYDTATLTKSKSYSGTIESTYSEPVLFANDGMTAYRLEDGEVFRYNMTESGITKVNIDEETSEDNFLPTDKWEQIREKYGYVEAGYDKKIIEIQATLNKNLIRQSLIEDTGSGKAALIFIDVAKLSLYGAFIEDVPIRTANIYISDDGTRAYVVETVETVDNDGFMMLAKKLTGNIYIYNVTTGAFVKKVVIDKLVGRDVLGTIGQTEAVRECSSPDGMTNVYRIYDGTDLNYYLVNYSSEPYVALMTNDVYTMSETMVSLVCFFSDK